MKKRLKNLRPEEKVFLIIAGSITESASNVNPIITKIDFLIKGNFNWKYFIRLAEYHYSLAEAYRFFLDIGKIDSLPANVSARLKEEYILAQARYLKKETELVEILKIMERNGIRPVVVKGVALAKLLYSDPGIRVSRDTDILVDPEEIDKATEILEQRGYRIYSGVKSIGEYKKYHFHLIFTRGKQMDSVIELHWSLLDPKRRSTMDIDTLKEKAVSIKVLGHKIKTLCLEHTLWHMSVHLSYLSFLNLRNLVEIKKLTLLLDRNGLNYALSWAGKCETEKELKIAITLSESLFGNFVPEDLAENFRVGCFLKNFALTTYYPRGLLWNWTPFLNIHEIVITFILKSGIKHRSEYLYRLVFPDQNMLHESFYYSFLHKKKSKSGAFIKKLYLLFKVLTFSGLLGFIVQGGIFSEKRLDSQIDMNQD
ncbi:MAG: nucleotidyltransferase family protein [Candidatus Krumholzibacteriota bacterium]|nr:nucleotidyltransferase family protein [Candidatus Krumholzibacteriota bacterium]